MPTLPVYDSSGAPSGEIEVTPALFGGEVNPAALHQVVAAQLAAGRQGTAHTKTRSEVAGSNRKLWRQKGTGRARVGDRRPPHRVGGGRVTGPRTRSYRQRVSQTMRQEALRSALAVRAATGEVKLVAPFQLVEAKTRALQQVLAAVGAGPGTLLVLGEQDEVIFRCGRNLSGIRIADAANVSPTELLAARQVILTTDALPRLEARVS